jgi:hypothetical protein
MNLLLIIISISFQIPQVENFEKIFGEKYEYALSQILSEKHIIDSISTLYGVDGKFTSSIIFPELIRFSVVRDYIEINSMEVVYVNTGRVDFSIGPFQIKPSFAEKIEKIVAEDKTFSKYIANFQYPTENLFEIRKERISRLKNTKHQLQYVGLFQRYIYQKYPFLYRRSNEFQLKFLSTAYNSGFYSTRKEIEANMKKQYFPWGALNNRKKYNYAEISWYYYQNEHLKDI